MDAVFIAAGPFFASSRACSTTGAAGVSPKNTMIQLLLFWSLHCCTVVAFATYSTIDRVQCSHWTVTESRAHCSAAHYRRVLSIVILLYA